MLKRNFRSGVVSVMVLALVLPGCVTTREDRIGVNDGSDACYQYRVALDSTGDFYAEDMLKGALVGAVAGAATGALARGDVTGALVGAAAGAALGSLGGYWNSKMKQGREQAVLGVLSDLDAENQNLGKTQRALDQLVNCRRAEIARVKGDFKAKRITRNDAELRLATIRSQLEKDHEIANKINANVVKRRDEFVNAADNISPGSAAQIRAGAVAAKPANGKKKPAKQQPQANDQASVVLARTTSAYETCEKISSGTSQIQQMAQKEATLEAA